MLRVGRGANKRTIQNTGVCKGAIIQHHKPLTTQALWTFPSLVYIACCQGRVVRFELVCSELSKIICEAIDDIVMEYVMEYFLDYITYSIL